MLSATSVDLNSCKHFTSSCTRGREDKETEIERRQKNADKQKTGKSGEAGDPRVSDLGRAIENDFAVIREKYGRHNPRHGNEFS